MQAGYCFERDEYLEKIKFQDASIRSAPSVLSGDFTEILTVDYPPTNQPLTLSTKSTDIKIQGERPATYEYNARQARVVTHPSPAVEGDSTTSTQPN